MVQDSISSKEFQSNLEPLSQMKGFLGEILEEVKNLEEIEGFREDDPKNKDPPGFDVDYFNAFIQE